MWEENCVFKEKLEKIPKIKTAFERCEFVAHAYAIQVGDLSLTLLS